MSVRKRSGSGGKRALKEKIVQLYESLFRGEQLATGNINFWEEFFLLKPKMAILEVKIETWSRNQVKMYIFQGEIGRLQADQLAGMRDNLNSLFHECVAHLGHSHQVPCITINGWILE